MKKPVKHVDVSAGRTPMPDEEFAHAYPYLTEHLCNEKYDDGSKRQRSSVTLFCEDGSVKLSLNDRTESRSLYVSSDTLQGALALLESACCADAPPWRAWPGKRKN
jgi:hypothetical protein